MTDKELEQQAGDVFGDKNVTEFARAIEQPYFISSNAPIDGVYVRAEAALEALQLKQKEVDVLKSWKAQCEADGELLVEKLDQKDKTIASLQERVDMLEASWL